MVLAGIHTTAADRVSMQHCPLQHRARRIRQRGASSYISEAPHASSSTTEAIQIVSRGESTIAGQLASYSKASDCGMDVCLGYQQHTVSCVTSLESSSFGASHDRNLYYSIVYMPAFFKNGQSLPMLFPIRSYVEVYIDNMKTCVMQIS